MTVSEMPELDHASLDALVADLERNRATVLCFEFMGYSMASRFWRFVSADLSGDMMKLHIAYIDGQLVVERGEWEFRLHDGWLVPDGMKPSFGLRIHADAGSSSVDGSLRKRIDDNLQRVFS